MKYKVRTIRGRHQYVQVDFEDEKYNLVGEMLMAEKSFLQQIIKMLESVTGSDDLDSNSFSGNAFSIYAAKETTKITNDINGEEAEAPTKELKKLAKVYQKQYGKIQF